MKNILSIVLLTVLLSSAPDALSKVKFYKADSDMPFVEMMLAMMVAMGVLDRVPPQFISRDYHRVMALQNPYLRYSGLGLYPASYNRYNKATLYKAALTGTPAYRQSLLGYPSYSPFRTSPYKASANKRYASPYLYDLKDRKTRRKSRVNPPASEFYADAFGKSSLNGVWMSDYGEMIVIKNGQFFWTNGYNSYMHGVMEITPDYVIASAKNSSDVIRYRYKRKGDTLITSDRNGRRGIFTRMDIGPDS